MMIAAGARVLVVDDQAELRDLVVEILRDFGCDVDEADSARAAIEMSRTGQFDAIVADVIMPGTSGVEMVRGIDTDELAVVFLSGNPHEAFGKNPELRDALFVPKPFASSDLLEALELGLLRRDRRRSTGPDAGPSAP